MSSGSGGGSDDQRKRKRLDSDESDSSETSATASTRDNDLLARAATPTEEPTRAFDGRAEENICWYEYENAYWPEYEDDGDDENVIITRLQTAHNFWQAAISNNLEDVKTLSSEVTNMALLRGNVQPGCDDQGSILEAAVGHECSIQLVEFLLKQPAFLGDEALHYREQAFSRALNTPNRPTFAFLLNREPRLFATLTGDGMGVRNMQATAIVELCSELAVLEEVIKSGSLPLNFTVTQQDTPDSDPHITGWTLLHFACYHRNTPLIDFLHSQGFNTAEAWHAPDKRGITPFMLLPRLTSKFRQPTRKKKSTTTNISTYSDVPFSAQRALETLCEAFNKMNGSPSAHPLSLATRIRFESPHRGVELISLLDGVQNVLLAAAAEPPRNQPSLSFLLASLTHVPTPPAQRPSPPPHIALPAP